MQEKCPSPYGWCPIEGCHGYGNARERSPNGDTICTEGHRVKNREWEDAASRQAN